MGTALNVVQVSLDLQLSGSVLRDMSEWLSNFGKQNFLCLRAQEHDREKKANSLS